VNKLLYLSEFPTGLVIAGLMILTFLTGPRWFAKWKLRFKVHRVLGIMTFSVALLHGIITVIVRYFL
jgi:DMSO/TMAO reductase YedYZ heme-binding membrane subunit